MTGSCIVIGAGLAGLAAARLLSRRGWTVTVLEAREKFGGRVVSFRFPMAPDLSCELGGEWIGDDHHRMKDLCNTFGLALDAHRFGFTFGGASGRTPKRYAPGAWPFAVSRKSFDAFGRAFQNYRMHQQRALDRLDWWTMLQRLGFDQADLRLRDLMDSTDFGETIRMTSAYAGATEYFGASSNPTDEMDWRVRGGNHLLIDALVTDIEAHGGTVRPNSVVRRIRQTSKSVSASIVGRSRKFTADHCICTVPARCLGTIDWDPPLPRDQVDASQQLQYARIVKTAVLYNYRFWKWNTPYGFSAFTGEISDFCFDSTHLQPGQRGILCSYAIGDKADDVAAEPDKRAIMRWITEDMKAIAHRRRGRRVVPLDLRMIPWQIGSCRGGAYALYRPGQWFTVQPLLARPYRRVHFAGEHLADWQGFMEGAVETGEAAARALL